MDYESDWRNFTTDHATYNLDNISITLALSGQICSMDKLLKDGLGINNVDKEGLIALHKVIIGKKEAIISHLLRKVASPHDGASPLHYAAQVGIMQTVKLLIKYNVDVKVTDNASIVYKTIRNRDIIKVLLVNGVDKNKRNNDGMTPLDLCLCYGKDFKSYDLTKLVKIVPANIDL
ncbi:hypothetical protein P3X46_026051 [Hevea brasiliensis]|uniref:PGG domain-containing protein n=1 Tax=Hevea brasiliensis TaxID=3981 RepID=A0ABQ9KVD4_HEVBR|nr:hypothetical protein P3X46_026051 [Hevea brasiliensis]